MCMFFLGVWDSQSHLWHKRKSNLSDDYSDDEEEESDFDHIGEIDSDSFSDKSQQDEFAFTLKKVSYKDLLQNYLNEKDILKEIGHD